MSARHPLVFIGLDSIEPTLVERWIVSDELPNLRALAKRGVVGRVEGPPGLGNGVWWPSLLTGVQVGKHGHVFNKVFDASKGAVRLFDMDHELGARPFWDSFSDAGLSCAVVDMCRTPLSSTLNGIQITDWRSADKVHAPRSRPDGLIHDVIARFGADSVVGLVEDFHGHDQDLSALLQALLASIDAKTRYFEELLSAGAHDAYFLGFGEAHSGGHYLWHLHDECSPRYSARLRDMVGDPMLAIYKALDGAVGRLLARLPGQANLLVFGGPGIGPLGGANHLLSALLDRLEYGPPEGAKVLVENAKSLYRTLVPADVRTQLRSFRHADAGPTQASSGRRFFTVPHADLGGFIRINLKGREPQGVVEPGAAYEALRQDLETAFLELINPDTGRPAVRRVIRPETHYVGERTQYLPDLIVEWAPGQSIEAVRSPRVGLLRLRQEGRRSGDHTDRGMFFFQSQHEWSEPPTAPVSYLDLAASIPALAGVPVAGLDGRPLSFFTSVNQTGT